MRALTAAAAASCAALVALSCSAQRRLVWIGWARRVLAATEKSALRQLAARPRPARWFSGLQQRLTSEATNTVDTDPNAFTGATVYQAQHELALPYPPIHDDTEAIAGLLDLVDQRMVKAGDLVLNLGGGAFDGGPRWLEARVPGTKVITADPFRRTEAHNLAVQEQVASAGGADAVVSISVLNVIAEVANRVDHIALAHAALRPGGLAYFKTWADLWPERGSGIGAADEARGTYQVRRWANAYLPEVEAVFGEGQCFADVTTNTIVAVKNGD